MNLLTDNPITRFFDSLVSKFRLGALLIDDIFEYLLPERTADRLQKLLYLAGIYYFASRAGKLVFNLYKNWRWLLEHGKYQRDFNPEKFTERYGRGSWAVVTGFSSGIGFAYACELAKRNFNLVLVDCHKERAEASERWIKQRNSTILTKVIILDLTSDGSTIQKTMQAGTEDVDVSILVNNAGMSSPGAYDTGSRNSIIKTWRVNVNAVVEMVKVFLPRMRTRYNDSAIINLSSGTGQLHSPYLGIYPSTKQYVRMFSYGLHLQNTDKIDVLCVKPMGVLTGMMSYRKQRTSITNLVKNMVLPEKVVLQSFYELGKVRGTFGAYQHKCLIAMMKGLDREDLFQAYAKGFGRQKW